jgi:hypothetical protein
MNIRVCVLPLPFVARGFHMALARGVLLISRVSVPEGRHVV